MGLDVGDVFHIQITRMENVQECLYITFKILDGPLKKRECTISSETYISLSSTNKDGTTDDTIS